MDKDEIFRKAIALLKDAADTPSASHRAYNVRAVRAMIHHWENEIV